MFALDPLSDALSFLKPRSSLSAGLDAGGAWGISFPGHDGIKFNAVLNGACWVSVESDSRSYRLEEGDCFLLTTGRPFVLATDLSLDRIESNTIYDQAQDGIATCNGGGDFFLVGGRFTFEGDYAALLFDGLPPVVHVRQASGQASVLRWALAQLAAEVRSRQPGGTLVAQHLAHIMLVHILRLYLDQSGDQNTGWFFALSNRQLGITIGAIHADPAHRWTVTELAGLAGMSRSTFAERFKQAVGVSPMEYVTRWRMLMAANRLQKREENISSIALSLGYESESAFSTAFKRTMARSPRQYQRDHAA